VCLYISDASSADNSLTGSIPEDIVNNENLLFFDISECTSHNARFVQHMIL